MANFILNLLPHKRLLIDRRHLGWIDVKPNLLRKALFRYCCNTFYFNFEPLSIFTQKDCSIESMSDAIIYRVCNELECQRKEFHLLDKGLPETIAANIYAKNILIYARKIIEQTNPSAVLFIQGYTMESAALRSVCIEKSIPFIAMENTSRNDRIIWDDCSGITVNRNLARNLYWRFHDQISHDVTISYHKKYIQDQKLFKSAEHSSPTNTYIVPDNKPLLTWIGQVYTDSSVLFGLNSGFTTPVDCIETLLLFAYKHQCRVFLKMHPKEYNGQNFMGKDYNRLTTRRILENTVIADLLDLLGDNVVLDDNNHYDTYSVISMSSLVVTVNSQAGLESAIRGIPVLLCGEAFYSGFGFAQDARNKQELYSKIEVCLNSELELSDTEEARRFNYIFFEKYCIPKSTRSVAWMAFRATKYKQKLS